MAACGERSWCMGVCDGAMLTERSDECDEEQGEHGADVPIADEFGVARVDDPPQRKPLRPRPVRLGYQHGLPAPQLFGRVLHRRGRTGGRLERGGAYGLRLDAATGVLPLEGRQCRLARQPARPRMRWSRGWRDSRRIDRGTALATAGAGRPTGRRRLTALACGLLLPAHTRDRRRGRAHARLPRNGDADVIAATCAAMPCVNRSAQLSGESCQT